MSLSRKAIKVLLACAMAALAVESLSSYAIYRNLARTGKAYYPAGSATVAALKVISQKIRGRKVTMWSEDGPVFYPDPTLGYAAHPGRYRIYEQFDGQRHRFQLTINEDGYRSTSYVMRHLDQRIVIAGDSAIFGWGLNDEDSVPWLLQARLPQYEVINESLTGYSVVHALLQLQRNKSRISPDDAVVVTYHSRTIELNVALASTFQDFLGGIEAQLAKPDFMASVDYPFGSIDAGQFAIHRINVSCLRPPAQRPCGPVTKDLSNAVQVTERAFDEIIKLRSGHLLVAITGGTDLDPVIAYLRSKGVPIVDLHAGANEPEFRDIIYTDTHSGAFWSHLAFERLLAALEVNQLIH